jgi:hypothetical protein
MMGKSLIQKAYRKDIETEDFIKGQSHVAGKAVFRGHTAP